MTQIGIYILGTFFLQFTSTLICIEVKRPEKDGVERVKVSYPKFKNGEATVRDVRVEPNLGKPLDLQMWTWNFCFEKSEKVLFLPSFLFLF